MTTVKTETQLLMLRVFLTHLIADLICSSLSDNRLPQDGMTDKRNDGAFDPGRICEPEEQFTTHCVGEDKDCTEGPSFNCGPDANYLFKCINARWYFHCENAATFDCTGHAFYCTGLFTCPETGGYVCEAAIFGCSSLPPTAPPDNFQCIEFDCAHSGSLDFMCNRDLSQQGFACLHVSGDFICENIGVHVSGWA